jgi:hypothetical protein
MDMVSGKPHYSCGSFEGDNLPCSNGSTASIAHDTDNDVFLMWGADGGSDTRGLSVYCYTESGTLSAAQEAAGCGNASTVAGFGSAIHDAWVEQSSNYANDWTVVGAAGVSSIPTHTSKLIYDPVNQLSVLIAVNKTDTAVEVWTFDTNTRTITKRSPAGGPPPMSVAGLPNGNQTGTTPVEYIGGGVIRYHVANSPNRGDWNYNITTNTWEDLGDLGGPSHVESMVYVPSTGKLWAFATESTTGGGDTQVWAIDVPPLTSSSGRGISLTGSAQMR